MDNDKSSTALDQTKFASVKKDVHESYQYFKDNYDRYNEFARFLFVSTMSDNDRVKLMQLGKPLITCNVLESFLSQRIAQFVKQQPSVQTHSKKAPNRKMLLYKMQIKKLQQHTPESQDDPQIVEQEIARLKQKIKIIEDADNAMLEFLAGHARDVLASPQNNQFGRAIYSDTTGGGFAGAEVFTRYKNEDSFEQEVSFEWDPRPCLMGFDPMAQQKHKGDGRYAFKCVPVTIEEFDLLFDDGNKNKSSKVKYSSIKKTRKVKSSAQEATLEDRLRQEYSGVGTASPTFEDFCWGYKNGTQKLVMTVEFYEKEYYDKKLNLLSDGSTATDDEYAQLKEMYEDPSIPLEPPTITQSRQVRCYNIMKYTVYQDGILKTEETDFDYLPLVFFDGNSRMVRDTAAMMYRQECRPYVYHAKGAQQWKDFCMQTSANEVENMVMSKFIMAMESMPDAEAFRLPYVNPQAANVLFFQLLNDQDPTQQLPGPREVQRTPTPSIVMESFYAADRVIQQVLGSYDTQPAMQSDLSGKAMLQGQLQSEGAADPYLQNYILSLNQVLLVYFSMLPKYIDMPRSVPVRGLDGKRSFKMINDANDEEPIMMNYKMSDFDIVLEAGPSAAAQKQLAIEQLTGIAKSFPELGKFIETEAGGVVFDNIDMQGSEALQEKYSEYKERTQQQAEQQQEQQTQIDMAMKDAEVKEKQASAKDKEASAAQHLATAITMTKGHDLKEQQFAAQVFVDDEDKQRQHGLDMQKLALEKRGQDASILQGVADIHLQSKDRQLEEKRVHAENFRTAATTALEVNQHLHQVRKDVAEHKERQQDRESTQEDEKELE